MSVLETLGRKCTLAASRSATWWAILSIPARSIKKKTWQTDRQSDGRRPYRCIMRLQLDAVSVMTSKKLATYIMSTEKTISQETTNWPRLNWKIVTVTGGSKGGREGPCPPLAKWASAQNALKVAIFRVKIEKFSGDGAMTPPQTPS